MDHEQPSDTGLVRRGLFLLSGILGLVGVVLWILFQRPEQPTPAPAANPEPVIAALFMAPDGGYPASVPWGAMAQLPAELPSPPGWEIRYNAALALARLGSQHVTWPVLAEMLDEQLQMRNFRVRLETGEVVPDEAAARMAVVAALKAVKLWHEKQKDVRASTELGDVYARVDALAASAITEVKMQAEEARRAIDTKK